MNRLSVTVAGLAPPCTHWVARVLLMPLSVFVAFIQTFVFMLAFAALPQRSFACST